MTTDNRTNEPSEAQLLAGLNAFYRAEHEQANIKRPFIDVINLDDWSPQAIARMRAALVAAQGAAPQAEQATYLNVAHSSVLAGSINARRPAREVSAMQLIDAIYDPDEDDANDSVRYGYVLEQFERLRVIYADLDDPDAGPAQVLPSSGVDEDKLAEVIGRDENYTREVELGGWMLDPRLAARAVAEWLKGQGGESRGE